MDLISNDAKISKPEAVNEATEFAIAMTMTQKKFWTNDLIWDEITSYLRISDLKALSLVNKQFLDKIRHNPRLVFKQTLKTNLEVHVPVLNRAVVEVDQINEYYLDQFGSEVFGNVTHLELQRLGEKSKQIENSLIKRIICHCKMLKSLAFGARNFFRTDYQDIFCDEGVRQILLQLDEVHIGVENKNYEVVTDDSSDEEYFASEDSDSREEAMKIKDMKIQERLFNKKFPDLDLKWKKFSFREPNLFQTSPNFYSKIILKNNLNLVDIDLELDVSGLDRLTSINIPNLASLKLQIVDDNITDDTQDFTNNLIPLIIRHVKNLKTFALCGVVRYSLQPIFDILKNSKKIRSLSLKSGHDYQDSIQSVNLDALQTLSTLRSFELKILDLEHENDGDKMINPIQLMNLVPELSDAWLRYLIALPSTVTSIQMFAFWKDNEIPQRFQVTETLAKFQNLTELSMILCYEFLLDDTLQFICSHLTKLRIFKADFNKITDYGISGCREDGSDSGISLKNLKGLNELKMSFCYRNCPRNITWKGLLKSVQFLELIHLTIGGSLNDLHGDSDRPDSEDGYNYLKLIQQNPSFESCSLMFYTPTNWFREEARKLNTRLNL